MGEMGFPATDSPSSNGDGDSTLYSGRDEMEMAKLGKKQQTKRNFGLWSILGLACTISVSWEALFAVFQYGLQNGGPAGLIYGYIFCWIGTLATAASMAELVSLAPTAGGQYHWVWLLAPESYRNFLSYVTGWQTTIAWQAAVASSVYLSGTGIEGVVILNYPNLALEGWHGTLFTYAVLMVAALFNTFLGSQLPKVELMILIIHIFGFIVVFVPLLYLAPHSSPHDVFAEFSSSAGYNNIGLSFFVGLLTAIYPFIGIDGAVHMCEEIQNASTNIPRCLIGTVVINGTLGLAALIAILFCLVDIDAALNSPTGFPLMEITSSAMGPKGATAVITLVLVLFVFATVSVYAAASRMLWAFARDNGIPGSRWFGRIQGRNKLPLNSLILTAVVSLLLALINIGSEEAFNAVLSLVIAGFLGSYLLPIGLIFVKRIRGDEIPYGPWKLGRWGIAANAFTLFWGVIVMFFSFWPSVSPVDAATMNWSCLLYGATTLFSIIFYFLRGRHKYNGPVIETEVVERIQKA